MKNIYDPVTRFLDLVFATLALFLLIPVLFPVILILRFTGEGEVFYRQQRVGFNGKKFYLIKFATMLKNSPNIGSGGITLRNDPRVLPVGHILRKTKVNELPQLINIIKGEMSFVGPRPLMEKQYNFYKEEEKFFISRMRPGLTGAASILFRDEEAFFDQKINPDEIYMTIIAPAKGKIETWYFKNRTVLLYFKLFYITILAVLFPSKDFSGFLDDNTKKDLQHVL